MNRHELKNTEGKTFLSLSYSADNQCIYAQWLGKPTPADMKRGAFALVGFIEETNAHALIKDKQKLQTPFIELNDWWVLEWQQKVEQLGIQYIAFINPETLLGLVSARDLAHKTQAMRHKIDFFTSFNEANAWLRSQILATQKGASNPSI